MRKKRLPLYATAILAVMLACMMAVFPSEALRASLKGMSIWWDVLFPALFPFFVISEMMLGVGLVHFFGTLLDPLMRPLFRVPGIGGFVMAIGFASGYPVGARLTSQLWEQKLVNREEGERLVAFTTTSDPIFLIGAVSVGFFHNAALAGILAAAHYGSAVVIGLLMRFHGKPSEAPDPSAEIDMTPLTGGIWRRAFEAMHRARIIDGRPVGVMLQQAISSGLQMVLVIGSLVVFFSVAMEVLTSAHMMIFFYSTIDFILQLFGLPLSLAHAVANGFFEVTIGVKAAGEAEGATLIYQTAIAAWVLSWAGLSVHAQIVSLLHHTNLRYTPFILARMGHGLLSAVFVFALWDIMAPYQAEIGSFLPTPDVTHPLTTMVKDILPSGGFTFAAWLGILLLMSALFFVGKKCMNAIRS